MQWNREDVEQRVRRAIVSAAERDVKFKAGDSLVLKLGFDSLRVASLAIALEEQLSCPVWLNDWVADCSDPQSLTVGSLCDYVWRCLKEAA